ncbi:MAG: gluconokinase [Terriglobales bacterium]
MGAAAARLIVVMGVSGSGKTRVGELLAARLGCGFLEGDGLHPAANIAKMAAGHALDDADRAPWLAAIHARLAGAAGAGAGLVVSCSALKQRYRDALAAGGLALTWVYLAVSPVLLRARLLARRGHFFKADLLESQLADLEAPAGANVITVDIAPPPEAIVQQILDQLRAR